MFYQAFGGIMNLEQTQSIIKNYIDKYSLQSAGKCHNLIMEHIELLQNDKEVPEFDMDLMWANAYIGEANAATINTVNTHSGATSFTSFLDATIGKGNCIYLHFGGDPDGEVEQLIFDITYEH